MSSPSVLSARLDKRVDQAQRHTQTHQLGQATGTQRFHAPQTVDLYRLGTDVEVCSDLAAGHALGDMRQYLTLLGAQASEALPQGIKTLMASAQVLRLAQRLLHNINQLLVVEGLLDEVESTGFECGDGHRHIAVTGHEDNRRNVAAFQHALLHLQPGQTRHAYIQQYRIETLG